MLNELKVKEVMTRNVITITPDQEVVFAFEKLMKNKISILPVVENDQVLGIVTSSDLGYNLILDNYELGTSVGQIMVKDIAYISPEDSIATAINKMNSFTDNSAIINQLIVIENDQIVGIISDGDIIKILKDTKL